MLRRAFALVMLVAVTALVGAVGARASNDPGFPAQWDMVQIGAPAAWARTTGSVRIGIVDTGIDGGHEDLAGRVVAFANCVGHPCSDAAPFDDEGHGTHVSGIAGATKDNGKGIAGVAPSAQFVVAKALDNQGGGNTDDVNAGIHWVVDHGAQVVNLSLGSDVSLLTGLFGDNSLSDGVEYAWSHNVVPVLASGNSNFFGLGSSNYGSAHAIVVGATGPDGEVASYSSPLGNAQWGVVAPGGDDTATNDCSDSGQQSRCVLSTLPANKYGYAQGTSMATPHVTGTIALLRSEGLSAADAVQRLLDTAAKVPCGSGCKGRIDAAAAVGFPPTPPPSASQKSAGTPLPVGTVVSPARRNQPATTRPSSAPTTTAPGTTSTEPATTSPTASDGSVQAAGPPRGQVRTTKGGSGEGRGAQVAMAIALLGGSAVGLGLLARTLRAGAAP